MRIKKPSPKVNSHSLSGAKKLRPRFRVGDRVLNAWDDRGKITGVFDGLAAACVHGKIHDVNGWLRGLSKKPKTAKRGVWYSVRPDGGGEMLAGELDLRPA